jgi:acetyltransferase-like isoleucine patch superfamily enzyme
MSEKEKMLQGQWHDANFDPALLEERRKAELLCYDFNMARPGSAEQQSALKELMGCEPAEGLTVLAPVYFDYGKYTHLGKGTFVNHGCYFMDGGTIHIGEHVFIGPFCGFYTASHPINYTDRNKGLERALPITVGDNCWFGANVSVMQGVTIGSGCVIAAGSVVTTDIPDNCMAAGVPATIKKRINQEP